MSVHNEAFVNVNKFALIYRMYIIKKPCKKQGYEERTAEEDSFPINKLLISILQSSVINTISILMHFNPSLPFMQASIDFMTLTL